MGVGLRPTWNTSFQLGLKLIQRKKVEGQSAISGNTGRALNNSRGRHSHHSLQNGTSCSCATWWPRGRGGGWRLNSEGPPFSTARSPSSACPASRLKEGLALDLGL